MVLVLFSFGDLLCGVVFSSSQFWLYLVSCLRGGFCVVCARGVGVLFAFVCVGIGWRSVALRCELSGGSLRGAFVVALRCELSGGSLRGAFVVALRCELSGGSLRGAFVVARSKARGAGVVRAWFVLRGARVARPLRLPCLTVVPCAFRVSGAFPAA